MTDLKKIAEEIVREKIDASPTPSKRQVADNETRELLRCAYIAMRDNGIGYSLRNKIDAYLSRTPKSETKL